MNQLGKDRSAGYQTCNACPVKNLVSQPGRLLACNGEVGREGQRYILVQQKRSKRGDAEFYACLCDQLAFRIEGAGWDPEDGVDIRPQIFNCGKGLFNRMDFIEDQLDAQDRSGVFQTVPFPPERDLR